MDENTVPSEFGRVEPPAAARRSEGGPFGETLYDGVRRFVAAVRDQFTVRNVYGDPIEAHGVTVVPVAQTYFGFGAGAGGGSNPTEEGVNQQGGGGGVGAGGIVRPIGFIEITASGARWVPMVRPWQRVTMGIVPPVIALLAGRALRRRVPLLKRG